MTGPKGKKLMSRSRKTTAPRTLGRAKRPSARNVSASASGQPSAHEPSILILAGPNGAGKTTFAREFLPREAGCPVFVNADLIAEGLSPFSPQVAAIRAGRLMLEMIAAHVARRESFAFETTLAGHNYARAIPRWRAAGYRVSLHFLSLPSPEIAIARVAERVRQGGHDVPTEVIRRRFSKGLEAFENVFKPIVDAWLLYDNSGSRPVLVDSGGHP